MPSPGDLPNPGIKSMSLVSPVLAGGFFTTSATWEAHINASIFFFFLVRILVFEIILLQAVFLLEIEICWYLQMFEQNTAM